MRSPSEDEDQEEVGGDIPPDFDGYAVAVWTRSLKTEEREKVIADMERVSGMIRSALYELESIETKAHLNGKTRLLWEVGGIHLAFRYGGAAETVEEIDAFVRHLKGEPEDGKD